MWSEILGPKRGWALAKIIAGAPMDPHPCVVKYEELSNID